LTTRLSWFVSGLMIHCAEMLVYVCRYSANTVMLDATDVDSISKIKPTILVARLNLFFFTESIV
jgi:hypothetical protein